MNEKLLQEIDKAIVESRTELAQTTIDLVNIKSVKSTPLPGAPFGEGPRAVLDAVLKLGEENGFACTDYGVGVISLATQAGQPDVGVWLHGDVVPEGDGWLYEPYNAVEYKGCIIGRGATDNKGQLAAIFLLMRIFKRLGIQLHYNLGLYVGSDEEFGMGDMIGVPGNDDAKGFLNMCTPPHISLVPDGGFPVGYGGKGGLTIVLKSKKPLSGWSFQAGLPDSPGRATAELPNTAVTALPDCTVTQGDITTVTCETPPRHGAHPDPNGNMITKLSAALLDADLVPEEDRALLSFYKTVSKDTAGEFLGIAAQCDVMSPLTVFAQRITQCDGYSYLRLNVRYPITTTFEAIVEQIAKIGDQYGFTVDSVTRGVDPYLMDINDPIIALLQEASNEVIGNNAAPFTMGGGTYAHRLPRAFVFGTNGNLPPEDFPKGHGEAHGIDEAVSLDRLQRAMHIYARALLKLNDFVDENPFSA
ncbi:MAG: Sapep family Mn(2+)-dependent dipeptidase [Clostridia bacterium]|nr:Sapep family Mn(2+)-dependent dipeptidase [Clostridia bacterium]